MTYSVMRGRILVKYVADYIRVSKLSCDKHEQRGSGIVKKFLTNLRGATTKGFMYSDASLSISTNCVLQ